MGAASFTKFVKGAGLSFAHRSVGKQGFGAVSMKSLSICESRETKTRTLESRKGAAPKIETLLK